MWIEDAPALVETGRTTVRFDGHPSTFAVALQGCPTPGCSCTDGTLYVQEVAPPAGAGLSFRVRLSLATGESRPPSEALPPTAVPLADALLRALPAEARAGARRRLDTFRAAELRHFVLDPSWLGQGGLWPFSHLLGGGRPDDPTYRLVLDKFAEPDGRGWIVQDLYCPRKGCDCKEVLLSFDADDGRRFTARSGFGSAAPTLDDEKGLTLRDAAAVYAHWTTVSERHDRARFEARYRTLREHVARASVPKGPRPTGAKEPCPCGSGKKYKHCHGARA